MLKRLLNFSSVRSKTFLTILPLIILTLVVMAAMSYQYSEAMLDTEIQNKMTAKLQGTINDIEKQLSEHSTLVQGLASTLQSAGNSLSKEQYISLLEKTVATSDATFGAGVWYEPYTYKPDLNYFGPYVYKDKGEVTFTEEYATEIYNYPDWGWYLIGKYSRERSVWTNPYYDPLTKVTMLTNSAPFFDKQGKFLGLVTGDLNFDTLQRLISDIHINIKADVYLLSNDGQYLADSDPDKAMTIRITQDPNPSLREAAKTMFNGHEGMFSYFREGARRVYYAPVPGFDWTLAIDVSEAELFSPLDDLLYQMIKIFALAIAVVVTALFVYSRYIINNIKLVNQFATAIVQGDLRNSLEVRSKDEFGQMTENLNKMMENLKSINEELELKVSLRTEELTATNQELIAMNDEILDANVKLNAEIDQRLKLQQEVQAKNTELSVAMENLKNTQSYLIQSEKMASLGVLVAGIAHEINTPIGVSITAASHFHELVHDFKNEFNVSFPDKQTTDEYLSDMVEVSLMIESNLSRASSLIKSFKQVSADQSSEEQRVFNIKSYIEEVIFSLRPQLKNTKIKIVVICKDDILINNYPGAFSQILTNLIINSLTHAFDLATEGKIVIKAEMDENWLLIHYSDNGKGISSDILPKIFDPFFTTNRSNGGTGLGLYILYTLISQKFGGTIECQSTLGKGTEFIIKFNIGG